MLPDRVRATIWSGIECEPMFFFLPSIGARRPRDQNIANLLAVAHYINMS